MKCPHCGGELHIETIEVDTQDTLDYIQEELMKAGVAATEDEIIAVLILYGEFMEIMANWAAETYDGEEDDYD